MCGRYYVDLEEENYKTRAILAELEKRRLPMSEQARGGEVYPSQVAPVILNEADYGVTVRPMKWGFPRVGGGGMVINSRSEKADTTPMFQRAARERRCLVPASWFFEWRRTSGRKTGDKFAFALAEARADELMYMAGFFGQFAGGFASGGYDGFAILTQAADEQMTPYHDRMPVILRAEALKKAWLDVAVPYAELRAAFETPRLTVQPVTPDVQKAN
ncbi:MAG TPA: SOS response-associated peptidase family protein [Candidatus Limiplasma sp.]|nr:SOS response-associated peptidase family protein [Candidatus Limiplasma sp.]